MSITKDYEDKIYIHFQYIYNIENKVDQEIKKYVNKCKDTDGFVTDYKIIEIFNTSEISFSFIIVNVKYQLILTVVKKDDIITLPVVKKDENLTILQKNPIKAIIMGKNDLKGDVTCIVKEIKYKNDVILCICDLLL